MKKAIVLGGTEDHIRLIEILKDKGFYTVLIDYFEYPPAKKIADVHIRESTLDLNKVTQLAKKLNPDLVITACIDQSLLTMAYVCEKLKEHNINGRRYFYPLISQFPTYKGLESAQTGKMPIAERVTEEVICLPIYPDIQIKDIIEICLILKNKKYKSD